MFKSWKVIFLLVLIIPFSTAMCRSQSPEAQSQMELYTVTAFKQIAFEVQARYTPLQMKIDILSAPANFDKTDVKGICIAMNLSGLKYRDLGAPGSYEIKVNWLGGLGPDAYFLTTVERMVLAEKELHEKKSVGLEGYFDFISPEGAAATSHSSNSANSQSSPPVDPATSLAEAVALGRKYLAEDKIGEAGCIFEILERKGKGTRFEDEIAVWSNLARQKCYSKWPECEEMEKENARGRRKKGVGKFTGKLKSIQVGDYVHLYFTNVNGAVEGIEPKLGAIEFLAEHPDDECEVEYQIMENLTYGEVQEYWDSIRIVSGNQNSDDFMLEGLKDKDLAAFNEELKPKIDALFKRFQDN